MDNTANVLIAINNAIMVIRENQQDPTIPQDIARDLQRALMHLYEAARLLVPIPPAEPT